MLQLLATILFFYVFILAAIVLTTYIVLVCARFFRESRAKQNKPSETQRKE